MAAALHLFHAKIHALSGTVRSARRVPSKDLSTPRSERDPQRLDLSNLVVETSNDRLVEQDRCVIVVAGQIHVTNRFLCQPCPHQLVIGIAVAQAEQHPIAPAFVETLGPGEQQFADLVKRVVLAAPVAERLVPHASSHRIRAAVRDPHDADGVIEVR
jgi:hypothetical protein